MSSGPHHKNMGWREANKRFTVAIKVSDQVSTGPIGELLQSKARIRSAISPCPTIREGARFASTSATRLGFIDIDLMETWSLVLRESDRHSFTQSISTVLKIAEDSTRRLLVPKGLKSLRLRTAPASRSYPSSPISGPGLAQVGSKIERARQFHSVGAIMANFDQ